MKIFERIDCPRCDEGKVSFIVEDNQVTSHGNCDSCDLHLSAERIQFHLESEMMVDLFMQEQSDLDVCDDCGGFMFVEPGVQWTMCQSCRDKHHAKRVLGSLDIIEAEAEMLLHKTKGGLLC